jgi:preprotein translocase subunit YajC
MEGFLFVLIAMFVFMYLLLIRPQRQQQRRHQELMANLKAGDEVITVGGIYGDVVGVESDRVQLEIAEDVEIEVAKRAIASVVPPEVETGEDAAAEVEAAQEEAAAETETAVATGEDGARR